ncbi:TPA: hypothetical protein OT963_002967 [Enterococcus faecalis]|uniref:hypothetical protein n=1 Tax=Enterococcus faecalis TaxID=1351 RepID=UPI001CF3097E|nr:hypothetical protein [Enterococcus faecalis]MCA6777744.1 hypothetical protein [Enterococcus faecalis]HCT6950292.1 hypothetical protein [Enterococcus faecalis]HCT6953165.1 hypothetical protein [Enterococcus faecalis]HCT6961314.1 hypothetical protein [Enterococcus faecalis]HCT8022686.1 hypothetical protein [Enterococcus faecalis]
MKNEFFRRKISAIGFGFLASYFLGKGETELFISTCVLAFILFIYSFDLAEEDRNNLGRGVRNDL